MNSFLRKTAFFSTYLAACGKNFHFLVGVLFFLIFPSVAEANVYATHIRLQNSTDQVALWTGNPLEVDYILNEPASGGVVLEILADTNAVRTILLASGDVGTLRGTNSVLWDGKDDLGQDAGPGIYSVRITAHSDGYSDWTQITSDADPGVFVWEPRGIAVNCNSNSPFYGRVFVSNSRPNPVRSTEPGDRVGILKLNADSSPADEGEYSNGGYPWAGDFFSPWKIEIADDDKVYINDWTTNGVVIAFDQLISTNYQIVLSSNNWIQVGYDPDLDKTNYSNLGGFCVTGSGTNTQLWMSDISFNQDASIAHSVGIRRWNLTNDGAAGFDDLGTTIVQAGFGSDLNLYPYDVAVDKNTNIYVMQYRANPNDTASKLVCYPPYDEEAATPETTNSLWKISGANNLVGAFGVAVNRDATLVAVALREGATIAVLDAASGTNVTTIAVAPSTDRRDVAWDNVGNLYSVDNLESLWRAYSPPGTNQATTVALQTVHVLGKPLLSLPSYDGVSFSCQLSGETNFNYVIETTSDFSSWIPVSTNFLTNVTQTISVETPEVQQFYRAVLAP